MFAERVDYNDDGQWFDDGADVIDCGSGDGTVEVFASDTVAPGREAVTVLVRGAEGSAVVLDARGATLLTPCPGSGDPPA